MNPEQFADVEPIAERARALWREASVRLSTVRVELFAKTAIRVRVTRDLDGIGVTFDRALESGLAVRTLQAGHDRAGFAASSGFDGDALRWAVDMAGAQGAHTLATMPRGSDVASERWDLDAHASLPTEETLTEALLTHPNLGWIQAGTTIEVLIGLDGWLAARGRHRLWALAGGPDPGLIAQRGFAGWEDALDSWGGAEPMTARAAKSGSRPKALVLTPRAAAPVVAALVERFHGERRASDLFGGPGWTVADEPARPDALAGGVFDDAGYPSEQRQLARDGVWVDALTGPGALRRASLRDPPVESASNLAIPAGVVAAAPIDAVIARRCRVIRSSAGFWVLELDVDGQNEGDSAIRRWLRVDPHSLLAACARRSGTARVTAAGPIVPNLVFDGLTGL